MLKKALILVLALVFAVALAGCLRPFQPSGQTTSTASQTDPSVSPSESSTEPGTTEPSGETTRPTTSVPSQTSVEPTETTLEPVDITYIVLTADEQHQVDLNGDGQSEQITYSVFNDYSFQLVVNEHIDGKVGENFLFSHIFLTDLDVRDGFLDVAVQELGPSDDYFTYFFYYDGTSLVYRGHVPGTICDPYSDTIASDPYGLGTIQLDGYGHLTARARGEVLYTWFYPQPWILDPQGQLQPVEQDYVLLTGFDEETGQETPEAMVTLKMDLPLYEQPGDSSAYLIARRGETAYLVRTDNSKWVQMRTEDDSLGWFELGDNIYSVMIGASEYFSEEVFGGLWYAD